MTMTETHSAKLSELKELLSQAVLAGELCFITGPSGAGKDYAAAQVMTNPSSWLFLDKIGTSESGKWEIPASVLAKSLGKARIFVGWADNLKTVAKTVLDAKSGSKGISVFIINPSPTTFRKIQAAKARDYEGKHADWKDGWLAKSKYSDSEVKSYLAKKKALILQIFKEAVGEATPLKFYLIENDAKSSISNGWHDWKLSDEKKEVSSE